MTLMVPTVLVMSTEDIEGLAAFASEAQSRLVDKNTA